MEITDEGIGVSQLLEVTCPSCSPQVYAYGGYTYQVQADTCTGDSLKIIVIIQ